MKNMLNAEVVITFFSDTRKSTASATQCERLAPQSFVYDLFTTAERMRTNVLGNAAWDVTSLKSIYRSDFFEDGKASQTLISKPGITAIIRILSSQYKKT